MSATVLGALMEAEEQHDGPVSVEQVAERYHGPAVTAHTVEDALYLLSGMGDAYPVGGGWSSTEPAGWAHR